MIDKLTITNVYNTGRRVRKCAEMRFGLRRQMLYPTELQAHYDLHKCLVSCASMVPVSLISELCQTNHDNFKSKRKNLLRLIMEGLVKVASPDGIGGGFDFSPFKGTMLRIRTKLDMEGFLFHPARHFLCPLAQ